MTDPAPPTAVKRFALRTVVEVALLLIVAAACGGVIGGAVGLEQADLTQGLKGGNPGIFIVLIVPAELAAGALGGLVIGVLLALAVGAVPAVMLARFNQHRAEAVAGTEAPLLRWGLRLAFIAVFAAPVVLLFTAPEQLESVLLALRLIDKIPSQSPAEPVNTPPPEPVYPPCVEQPQTRTGGLQATAALHQPVASKVQWYVVGSQSDWTENQILDAALSVIPETCRDASGVWTREVHLATPRPLTLHIRVPKYPYLNLEGTKAMLTSNVDSSLRFGLQADPAEEGHFVARLGDRIQSWGVPQIEFVGCEPLANDVACSLDHITVHQVGVYPTLGNLKVEWVRPAKKPGSPAKPSVLKP